jgi:hypothetical protein
MAGFKFDYKPFDYGDFYGAGGGGGGGGQGGGGKGGGGGGGRGNNQNGRNFSDNGRGDNGGNYRQRNGRGDNMNWQNGRNDGVNRFRGGGQGGGGGVKRDDLLPDKTGGGQRRSLLNMVGGGEARDMFGMRRNMPETTTVQSFGGDGIGRDGTARGLNANGDVKGDGLNGQGLERGHRFGFGEVKPREGFTDGQNAYLQNIASSGIEGVHNFGPMANKMARKAEMWAGRGHDVFGGMMGGGSSFGADGNLVTASGTDTGLGSANASVSSFDRAELPDTSGFADSGDYLKSMDAARKASDLAHRQNLYAQNKGNAYATDFDYSQLAGMKPRDAYRSMQPPPPPRMPRQPR